jgi:hypothetical protein
MWKRIYSVRLLWVGHSYGYSTCENEKYVKDLDRKPERERDLCADQLLGLFGSGFRAV